MTTTNKTIATLEIRAADLCEQSSELWASLLKHRIAYTPGDGDLKALHMEAAIATCFSAKELLGAVRSHLTCAQNYKDKEPSQ